MRSQNAPRRLQSKKRGWWVGEMIDKDNAELAQAFVKTSSAQQTLVLLTGIFLFYGCVPAFFINPAAGSAVLLSATSIFCLGLIYDVRLILDQQDEADKARNVSLEVSHLLEKRIAWRWTAVVLNFLGSIFSVVACVSYFPAAKAKGKAQKVAIWNANALFGLGTLLFCIGYELVSWDVVTIRHTLAEMNGERVPYWDTTAKVMWGFGISLALFALGNFFILLPAHAFVIAGGVMFGVGAIIITGMTWWQAQFQWDEHVKEYYSGKTGANLGLAGQVLDGGASDVEQKGGGSFRDEDAGLRTPLLPGSASRRGGDGGGGFGAADYGPTPRFSGRGGPVSVGPGGSSGRFSAPEESLKGAGAGAVPGRAQRKGEGWGSHHFLPKRGGGGQEADARLVPPPAAQPEIGKGGLSCWTERL